MNSDHPISLLDIKLCNALFGSSASPCHLVYNLRSDSESRFTSVFALCLPLQATLSLLLDHLSLVASFSSSNRMTHQNLAVCFGPVLLTPTQEAWRAGGGGGGGGGGRGGRGGGKGFGHGEEIASAVDFKRHIEALHYLLQLWPGETN